MVENTGTALATGLVDAQVADEQLHRRFRELATAGKENPGGLKPEEIGELCSAVLQLLPDADV